MQTQKSVFWRTWVELPAAPDVLRISLNQHSGPSEVECEIGTVAPYSIRGSNVEKGSASDPQNGKYEKQLAVFFELRKTAKPGFPQRRNAAAVRAVAADRAVDRRAGRADRPAGVQRTLQRGSTVGLATGLGAAVADAVYGAVGAFGVNSVIRGLQAARVPLALAGGAFLLWLAWRACHAPPADRAAPVADARSDL